MLDENEIEFVVENSDLLLDTMSRIETQQNLESVEYFCTTLKNLTVNNELICFISEKEPFQLLKNMFKHLLQVCSFSLLHIKKTRLFSVKRSNGISRSTKQMSNTRSFLFPFDEIFSILISLSFS